LTLSTTRPVRLSLPCTTWRWPLSISPEPIGRPAASAAGGMRCRCRLQVRGQGGEHGDQFPPIPDVLHGVGLAAEHFTLGPCLIPGFRYRHLAGNRVSLGPTLHSGALSRTSTTLRSTSSLLRRVGRTVTHDQTIRKQVLLTRESIERVTSIPSGLPKRLVRLLLDQTSCNDLSSVEREKGIPTCKKHPANSSL